MTGVTDSTPSTVFNSSTYFVLKFAEELLNPIAPGRVKMISAVTFEDRFCKSSDIPCASPVNSMISATPRATPMTLMTDLSGRCRRFETTKLSKLCPFQTGNINTRLLRKPSCNAIGVMDSLTWQRVPPVNYGPDSRATLLFLRWSSFLRVQINFRQVPFVRQQEYISLIVMVQNK